MDGEAAARLPLAAVEEIASRLSQVEGYRLPAQLENENEVTQAQKETYFQNLLLRDPGVFLERYGTDLSAKERDFFAPLQGDYEIGFWLRHTAPVLSPPVQNITTRNRRAAALYNLEQGTFFSEDEMRERAPLLHHQYIGQYEGPAPVGRVNNNKLSESILQQHDELQIRSRLAVQQQALEIEEFDEDSEEEEEDDEQDTEEHDKQTTRPEKSAAAGPGARREEGEGTLPRRDEEGGAAAQRDEGEGSEQTRPCGAGETDNLAPGGAQEGLESGIGASDGANAGTGAMDGTVHISAQQQAENREEFLSIMKARFLAGDEEGVNYDAIDKDASLDEHWAKEEQQDAEDKYFGDVE